MSEWMDKARPQIGQWYVAYYGFQQVTGKCIAVNGNTTILSFRWGNPYRTNQIVSNDRIFGPVPDPRWFGLRRLIFGETRPVQSVEEG